jgi:uncharacterized protein (TIGR02145 family)
MFYQWNRKKAWPAIGDDVANWDATDPEGDSWEKANDPSPSGWRIPTLSEIQSLFDTDKVDNVWTTRNGINGRKFTDKATGSSMFLPAVGFRYFSDGTLSLAGSYGNYWGRTVYGAVSCYLDFDGGYVGPGYYYSRADGLSVRSVAE